MKSLTNCNTWSFALKTSS